MPPSRRPTARVPGFPERPRTYPPQVPESNPTNDTQTLEIDSSDDLIPFHDAHYRWSDNFFDPTDEPSARDSRSDSLSSKREGHLSRGLEVNTKASSDELRKAEVEARLTWARFFGDEYKRIVCPRPDCHSVLHSQKDLKFHIHIHIISDTTRSGVLYFRRDSMETARNAFQCAHCTLAFADGDELAGHECYYKPLAYPLNDDEGGLACAFRKMASRVRQSSVGR